MKFFGLAFSGLGLVVLSACGAGSSAQVDAQTLEKAAVSFVRSAVNLEVVADCGDQSLDLEVGRSATCSLTFPDGQVVQEAEVELVEVTDEGYRVQIRDFRVPGSAESSPAQVIGAGELSDAVSQKLAQQLSVEPQSVNCLGALSVEVGSSQDCEVTFKNDAEPRLATVQVPLSGRADALSVGLQQGFDARPLREAVADFEDVVAQALEQESQLVAEVSCEGDFIDLRNGTQVACQVSLPAVQGQEASTRKGSVTVTNVAGAAYGVAVTVE